MIGRGTLVDRVCVVSVCVKIRVRCPTCVRTHWASHAAFHLWIVITWLRCASDCLGCNWTFRRSVRLTSARNYVRCLHFQTNWSFFCLYILPAPRSEESTCSFLNRKVHFDCCVVRGRDVRVQSTWVQCYTPSTLFHRINFHVRCGYS